MIFGDYVTAYFPHTIINKCLHDTYNTKFLNDFLLLLHIPVYI